MPREGFIAPLRLASIGAGVSWGGQQLETIIPWDEARKREHARGFAMPFVNESCGAETLRMHGSVIDPGQAAHEPHAHEGEEIMFVLDGTAEIRMGEETRTVGASTAVFCPPNVLHGIRNAGETPIRYMIIRTA
jgi:quercetin dioxygenase-like cupin family protein